MVENNQAVKRSEIEIMAPVGSWESLAAAFESGADSVYFGVQGLNMRSNSSSNFNLDDLAEIVKRCKQRGVRSYLTLNTVLFDNDSNYMHQVLDRAKSEGVTAVIIADQSALLYAKKIGLEIHISTQVNISNIDSVEFYAQYADVVVLARELNLEQVHYIYSQIKERDIRGPRGEYIQIEMFAHGALCMATSGKCYLSLHEAWKSANRGACRQICRRQYNVTDIETGSKLMVDNQYIMSPKDLCTIEFLDKMVEAGVRVLKIEGRARSAEYVMTVVQAYSQALKAIEEGVYTEDFRESLILKLKEVFNRGFWAGYYLGHKVGELGEWTSSYGSSATKRKVYVGKVTNYFSKISVAEILIEASELSLEDELLFLGETTGAYQTFAKEIRVELLPVNSVCQGTLCSIETDRSVRRGDKLYKLVDAK